MLKRIADVEDRKKLNRGYSKDFNTDAFNSFFERIVDLWFQGKATKGLCGIYPVEVSEEEIIFELRDSEEVVSFSTLMFPEVARLTHRKAWKKIWKEKPAPPPTKIEEMEYVPAAEELKEVRKKLGRSPAWILDRTFYRDKFLLEFSEVERDKRKKKLDIDGPEM